MSAVLADAIAEAAARQAQSQGEAGCFHCGRPPAPDSCWQATIEGSARAMCCAGCAAAGQAIADAGCAAYYATRAAFAPPAACAAEPDAGPASGSATSADPRGKAEFTVEGVRCAAGVWLVERSLGQLTGVRAAQMDLASARVTVRWDPSACSAEAILQRLRAIGLMAWPGAAPRHGAGLEWARRALLRQMSVAGLSTLQVTMYALPAWLVGVVEDDARGGGADAASAETMDWAGLLFALPALLYSARPFFGGAWRGLRRGVPDADLPLALGIGAAFAGSCAALLSGAGEVYFGSVALFIFLLLGCRYLGLAARRQAAGALEQLQRGLPQSALRLRGDPLARDTELVPAGALQAGDLVLVPAGQAAPADGIVDEGDTVVDLALLSGESRTRRRGPGDTLPGGALNVGQAIVLRVISGAGDSTLALLVRLAERAVQGKPALARRADRATGWFMGGLLALAVLVFCAWLPSDAARAWQSALAVLVAGCPCALSLATPSALVAATDRLLRRGVLALRPHTLETFDRATHVVFDKTGTLTHGRPELRQAVPVGALGGDACLRIAAALVADNPHPLARPIRAAAEAAQAHVQEAGGEEEGDEQEGNAAPLPAERVRFVIGQGVEGWVGNRCYRLGSAAWVEGVAGGVARAAVPAGTTAVWLGNADGWLARFDLCDELRPDAADVVRRLRAAGKTVLLLSGDDHETTQQIAAQLGIAGALGGKLPEEKLNYVRRLQRQGAVVAMVGDGVNDAAVLRGADVSFAMGRGAELAQLHAAQLHADVLLLGEGLQPLADAADTARRTLAVIRQNLAWVTLYNVVAIPAAAVGLLQPWMAGLGMAAGSALVVLNALRLRGD